MTMVISRKYEVVSQLGQGGMGVVYKVRHVALDTILALKVLPTHLMDNQDLVHRFYREARIMARLSHPNIVRVRDIDRDEDLNLSYFVMEYIEGVTLGRYLREKGPLPLPELLDIAHYIADALVYAHTYTPPVIHRDIKPTNIMIEEGTSRVVVMDFGIAKELGDGDPTNTGMMIGTFKYASPEQLRHEPLDGRADVYSLGMVMYEMYTGKQFFRGLDKEAVVRKVLDNQTENEPHFDRSPPPPFAHLLTGAIAKSRSRRYHSMSEFLQALDGCRNLDLKDEVRSPVILNKENREQNENESSGGDDSERQISERESGPTEAAQNPFHTAGALPTNAPTYIERLCDQQLECLLKEQSLIAVYGDYEVGKSSLLTRMHGILSPERTVFIKDLSGLRPDNDTLLIEGFFKMVSQHLGPIETWEELASGVQRQPSIFLLDELGTLSPAALAALIPQLHWLSEKVKENVRIVVTLHEPIPTFLRSRGLKNP